MNRRTLLGGASAASAARTVAGAAVRATPANPDAALTAAVSRYTAARTAYDACNARIEGLEVEQALGAAYCATLSPVRDAPATTLASLIAKARVAKKELAVNADGSEDPPSFVGDEIGRSIINDLLRLSGGGA